MVACVFPYCYLMCLSVVESEEAVLSLVVFSVDSSLVLGGVVDADDAVRTVLTHHVDLGVTHALLHQIATLFELNYTRL